VESQVAESPRRGALPLGGQRKYCTGMCILIVQNASDIFAIAKMPMANFNRNLAGGGAKLHRHPARVSYIYDIVV
jgi:hypothetical protein